MSVAGSLGIAMYTGFSQQTPVGEIAVVTQDGSVVGAGFQSLASLRKLIDPNSQHEFNKEAEPSTKQALEAYFDGDLGAFEKLNFAQKGTDLQVQLWQALSVIPAGETRTYTELAKQTSKPKAIRAAASACGKNQICVFVPCHRAIRSDGSLGGYRYGLEIKTKLLEHESKFS